MGLTLLATAGVNKRDRGDEGKTSAVALAVLVLRRRNLKPRGLSEHPAFPYVPLGAVLVCGYMAAALPALT